MTRYIDAWDRQHEREHPEEYYRGFRLLPVLIQPGERPAIDIYDPAWGSLCTVPTVERAKGWIDGQTDVADRLFAALFEP